MTNNTARFRMNREVKKLWVEALRSGKYKQGTSKLRREDRDKGSVVTKFCCLGVLCNLHAEAHPKIARTQKHSAEYLGHDETVPQEVMRWAGLTNDLGNYVTINHDIDTLAGHNDDGMSFKQIAHAINTQL